MAGKKEAMKGEDSKDISTLLSGLSSQDYCYLMTTGRVSGQPHEIEIWFGMNGNSLYLLSGGGKRSDWVRNLLASPHVSVRIAKYTFNGAARIVTDEQEELMARRMLAVKYQGWKEGQRLSKWAREALPVAVDLESPGKL